MHELLKFYLEFFLCTKIYLNAFIYRFFEKKIFVVFSITKIKEEEKNEGWIRPIILDTKI